MTNRLDAIKARLERATEAPWFFTGSHTAPIPAVIEAESAHYSNDYEPGVYLEPMDAEFIAHARTDVPALVAAVEAVLELHKLVTDDGKSLRNWLGVYDGKPRGYCDECEVDGYTAVPYPCPTVTAIREALGEKQ